MGSPACTERREWVEASADRALVERARGGDAPAFEEIVRTYQRRIYGVALRMTRRHEVADDITQETFVRAYTRLHRFELGRPLAPWLVRIAVNLSIDHLNGVARREVALPDERQEPVAAGRGERADGPHEALVTAELAEAADAAIENLSAEQKAVLVLKVHEEMRYEEIAEALGISVGTVMSRLFRARAKLKRMLQEYL